MRSSLPALGLFEIRAFKDYPAEIAALTTQGFSAQGRPDLPPHPFRLPFDWHADPFGDRNWMFQLHSLRLLDPYLNRLRNEPDHPEAFSATLEIVADWYRANVLKREGRFTWYDMATGLRALKLAYVILAARACEVDLPDPEMMDRLISLHIAKLTNPNEFNSGNHGLFQMNGLMALIWLHPELPSAKRARSYAVTQMKKLLASQLGEQGVHTEDAPYYHFFATRKIERILSSPWWRIADMASARVKLARAEAAADWLVDPAGRCVAIGDSNESVQVKGFASLEKWPHVRLDDHLGAIVDGYGIVRSAPQTPLAESSMLFLMASFHAPAHKHSDCMSFVWQEGGENILIDPGKYGYERDAMRKYFQSTRAHNTVEVDGKDFSRDQNHAYGSGMRRIAPMGQSWLIDAEADHRHAGIAHRRCVFFRPGKFVLAVDHIADAGTGSIGGALSGRRDFTSWWHFDPSLTLLPEKTPGGWRAAGLPGGRTLLVSHVTAAEGLQSHQHLGEMKPRQQGWISRSYLGYQPAPALGFSAWAASDYFAATLFEIAEAGQEPTLSLEWRPTTQTVALDSIPRKAAGFQVFRLGAFALETSEALL